MTVAEAAGTGARPAGKTAHARRMRLATYASIAVAATLIITKFFIWRITGSVALLSSLLDSALDVMASLINAFAVHQALQPADREHRFGHGKAEALAALAQALIVGGSAIFLIMEAGNRLVHPKFIENGGWGIAVMALSLVLSIVLVRFQRKVVRETGSLAVSADAAHYATDTVINVGVLAGLALMTFLGWSLLDPLIAIAVSFYLIATALKVARAAFDMLMDREFGDDVRKTIRDTVLAHPEVKAMHDLRTRSSGIHSFIQFHLEMDPKLTLEEAHRISDEVERSLYVKFPHAEVLIHEDPAGMGENRPSFA